MGKLCIVLVQASGLYAIPQTQATGWTFLTPKHWQAHESLRSDKGVLLHVVVTSPHIPTPRSPAVVNVLHKTIRGIKAADIRFTVFDRRSPSGKLSGRRVLFADGKVISANCKFLKDVLFCDTKWAGLLVEETLEDDDEDPDTAYLDLDSDFGESDTEETDGNGADNNASVVPAPTEEDDEAHVIKQENIEEEEGSNSMHVDISNAGTGGQDSNGQSEGDSDEEGEMMDVIVVGASSVSWEALIFYLYTGDITFDPLSGAGNGERTACVQELAKSRRNAPKPCSPKAMYRLAHELQLSSLQRVSLIFICSQLNHDNIIAGVFSSFTAKYDAVKQIELEYLAEHWSKLKDSNALKEAMMDVARGAYPHAGGLLAEIFQAVGNVTVKGV